MVEVLREQLMADRTFAITSRTNADGFPNMQCNRRGCACGNGYCGATADALLVKYGENRLAPTFHGYNGRGVPVAPHERSCATGAELLAGLREMMRRDGAFIVGPIAGHWFFVQVLNGRAYQLASYVNQYHLAHMIADDTKLARLGHPPATKDIRMDPGAEPINSGEAFRRMRSWMGYDQAPEAGLPLGVTCEDYLKTFATFLGLEAPGGRPCTRQEAYERVTGVRPTLNEDNDKLLNGREFTFNDHGMPTPVMLKYL